MYSALLLWSHGALLPWAHTRLASLRVQFVSWGIVCSNDVVIHISWRHSLTACRVTSPRKSLSDMQSRPRRGAVDGYTTWCGHTQSFNMTDSWQCSLQWPFSFGVNSFLSCPSDGRWSSIVKSSNVAVTRWLLTRCGLLVEENLGGWRSCVSGTTWLTAMNCAWGRRVVWFGFGGFGVCFGQVWFLISLIFCERAVVFHSRWGEWKRKQACLYFELPSV